MEAYCWTCGTYQEDPLTERCSECGSTIINREVDHTDDEEELEEAE